MVGAIHHVGLTKSDRQTGRGQICDFRPNIVRGSNFLRCEPVSQMRMMMIGLSMSCLLFARSAEYGEAHLAGWNIPVPVVNVPPDITI